MEDVPPIHFAPARGGRIAYQRFGSGPVVFSVPPSAQNIETAWEWPAIRSMFEHFGSFCDFIHFDKRGTGASDIAQSVPGIDERVDDMRAVMDHAGIDHAYLWAQSEGGPLALLFAAAYPDRVDGLVLNGTSARMRSDNPDLEAAEAFRNRWADAWGTPDSITVRLQVPSLADDPEFNAWFQRYERTAASSEGLRDLMAQSSTWDVRDVVPDITCPILVTHRRDDPTIPIQYGREIVDLARDATMVELEGSDHFAFVGEREWLDHLERFVTGTVAERPTSPSALTAPVITLTTLGRFAVAVDGEEVPTGAWGSRRARTLVKRLAAARGWPVRREEIADLLWPDEPDPAVWGSRLSVQLSTVRRVLKGGIIADRQTIALDLDAVDLDLVHLHAAPDDEAIVAVHVGPFLPEEATEAWRRGPHQEALTVARAAGHRLLGAALDAPDPGRATELAHLLLGWDEHDAIAHDAAVEAAELAGDPAAAAAARERRDAALA